MQWECEVENRIIYSREENIWCISFEIDTPFFVNSAHLRQRFLDGIACFLILLYQIFGKSKEGFRNFMS